MNEKAIEELIRHTEESIAQRCTARDRLAAKNREADLMYENDILEQEWKLSLFKKALTEMKGAK